MNLDGYKAPNRVLDLMELDSPGFRSVLREMDKLVAQEDTSYLHPSKRWEYPWALERAKLPPGSRVLDAGCGASIFPVYLARCGYKVCAADLNPAVELARQHDVEVDYQAANLTDLPYPNGWFDAVFCISVIEHLGHDGTPAALQELRRVLRPGGLLLLTTDFYEDAEAELWYEGPGGPFPVDWGFFDERRLRQYLVEAPGLSPDGVIDLKVDWEVVKPRMREFHGYPYTSVGLAMRRVG